MGRDLRDEPYAQGDHGIGSAELEALQRRLRGDGREDLADSVLRIQVALEDAD